MRINYGSERLGFGRHGRVFVATSTMARRSEDVGRVFAVKKTSVTNHVRHPMLLHEACALVLLRGHPGFPRAIAWGRSQYFEYLVMERLGCSLKDLIGAELTLRNLVAVICQMLDIIEYLHEKGIVHCDVKPGNFLFGLGENAGRLHLIDFGLARPWIDPATGKPFPEEPSFGFRGTALFASRHVHLGHTPSRRDDMESLAYTLVNLLTGTLPWINAKYDADRLPLIYAHNGSTLCHGYDDVFARFVDYTRSLAYDDTPDYEHWRRAFRGLVAGLPEDPLFDPNDDSEPRVGVQKNLDPLPLPLPLPPREENLDCPKPSPERDDSDSDSAASLERVLGGSSRSSKGGDHGFAPNWGSSWWTPGAGIRAGDVFGDEFAIVSTKDTDSGVEFVDAPPDYSRGSCVYPGLAPPEEMKNEQSDSRCI